MGCTEMKRMLRFGCAAAALLLSGCDARQTATSNAGPEPVERGRYLVTVMACTDCHTPGSFMGMPDMSMFLGGQEVGFERPGLGVFYPPNLTPDPSTGLGNWTEAQIVAA